MRLEILEALPSEAVRGPDGERVYSQRLTSGEFVFLARDVPAFGAKRFSITRGAAFSPGSATVDGATPTTSTLSVRIDKETGGIASLRSRTLARDLVDASSGIEL